MLREKLISLHRHSGIMLPCCCIIAAYSVWVSVKGQLTFVQWISTSYGSAFLQFHIWSFLYHALNFGFLGRLRPFERAKARKGQLCHFFNTLIFIVVACGFDIFEGLCWLHWVTPFSFFRMSLILISERLKNPTLPSMTSTNGTRADQSSPEPVKHQSGATILAAKDQGSREGVQSQHLEDSVADDSSANCIDKGMRESVMEAVRAADGDALTEQVAAESNQILPDDDSLASSLAGASPNSSNGHSPSSPCSPLSSSSLANTYIDKYQSSTCKSLTSYLFILIGLLSLWCLCGSLVFRSLSFTSKLMVLYEVCLEMKIL